MTHASTLCDFPEPFAHQFQGSSLAKASLKLIGWQVHFKGFPTLQGIAVVYPHTSNWDAPIMFLAKWAVGVQVMFWGKDTLFRIPLVGAWLRWLGGVPVKRTSPEGIVGQAVAIIAAHKADNSYFWLGLAPEGTRKFIPGWRSGFYQTAVRTGLPLCLIKLDYSIREISIVDFMQPCGQEARDMARIAALYQGVQGKTPANAAPVRILDAAVPRTETVVKP